MKRTKLLDGEILVVSSFLKEVITLPIVEGVHLLPYFNSVTRFEQLEIIVIYNTSLTYIKKVTEKMESLNITNEISKLEEIVNKFKAKCIGSRCFFYTCNFSNYSILLKSTNEILAEKSLISSVVLFDRFGDVAFNKKRAANYLLPFPNTVLIDNIDEVISNK